MENENVLDNEIDVEETDVDLEENDVADEDADDEFEYDENGDIVVPDVEFDSEEEEDLDEEDEEETPEEDKDEDTEDEDHEDEGDGESEEVPAAEKKEEEPSAPPEPDPRDSEISDLRARLNALERQAKDTLEAIGVKSEDAMSGLVKVAAEAKDQSEEEYNADKAKRENDELARQMLRNQLFEAKAAADLKELHALYPETKQYKHIKELPLEVLKTFGKQRDAGFSVKQAYAAANPDGIRKEIATSVKKQAQHDTKAHLRSTVPKPSKSDGVSMSKAELFYWRELFPGKSDAEIRKIYKQSQ